MTVDIYRAINRAENMDVARKLLDDNSMAIKRSLAAIQQPEFVKSMEAAISPIRQAAEELKNSPALREAQKVLASIQVPNSPILSAVTKATAGLKTLESLCYPARAIASQFDAVKQLGTIAPSPWFAEINETLERAMGQFAGVFEAMQRATAPFARIAEGMLRAQRQRERMEKAGWLPHYTIPFEAVEEANDEAIDSILEKHYTENWGDVKAAFLSRLEEYDIDDEAKATFRETLQAHETGLYRTVPRTLFPEIERIARQELHEGNMAPIASQPKLIEVAGNLCPDETESYGLFGLMLYSMLSDHLYMQCHAQQLPDISKNPVPNRHAVIHGHVSYSKMKNSINSLIMTEFIFQVINAAKKNRAIKVAA